MYVVLLLALVFVGSALFNTFGPSPSMDDTIAATGIALVLFAVFAALRRSAQRSVARMAWLLANAAEIEQRGATFEGRLVRPDTVLVRHQYAISCVIMSFRFETQPVFEDIEPTFGRALGATVTSLAFGWWGIPWGPIYTVQAVVRNLRGGVRETVAERLAVLQAMDAPAVPQAA